MTDINYTPKSKESPDDFTEEFKPRLRSFQKTALIGCALLIGLLFLVINSGAGPLPIILFLIVPASVYIYAFSKIKCPRCGRRFLFSFSRSTYYGIPFFRRCWSCGAMLTKGIFEPPSRPWVSWHKKTKSDKIFTLLTDGVLAIIAVSVIIVVICKILKYFLYGIEF